MKNLIGKNFFAQDAEIVAKNLLGKIIVRKLGNKFLKAKIIETEAYYDAKDPASRACQNGDLKETMKQDAGTLLIYGIHNNWLMNIVTGKRNDAQAVLLRAIEPLNFKARCNGPGLLTKALKIDKSFHKRKIKNKIFIINNKEKVKIYRSHRVGVKKDLKKKLRFFIK